MGKSTLVNSLVGFKAAIVSDKPQTTRNRIQAVLTRENAQVIFMDTPGIHRPRHKLGSYMVNSAKSSLSQVEVILFMVDGSCDPGKGDRFITGYLQDLKTPIYLVLNKMDLLTREQAEQRRDRYMGIHPFHTAFMVSALYKENLESLLQEIIKHLPPGPMYFPPDMVTDQPETFVISEIVREKIFALTREEIPFSVAVAVEEISKRENRDLLDLRVTVYVEKSSQKGIVIGKNGALLKEAGSRAREEIEALLGSKVFLDLWVKVKPNWKDKEGFLQHMGYRRS